MDKILNLYKPKGITSHDLVDQVRLKFRGEKVGHGGTLDPMAKGILLIGVGRATKRLTELTKLDKQYKAKIVLGLGSVTDDLENEEELLIDNKFKTPTKAEIGNILIDFTGTIDQKVPLYSATHYQGEKLYKRARRGERIPYSKLPSKKVTVNKIDLINYQKDGFKYQKITYPTIELNVTCSSGTYIRSIARDLGRRLNTFGVLAGLIRARIGKYKIEDSLDIKDL